jgi:DNA-binding NtrC family response regulator
MDLKADVVAATNCNLSEALREKQFRQDLFDRLNGQAPIRLLPVSERDPDDIAAIWNTLLARAATRAGVPPPPIMVSRSEAAQLAQRAREGNVRAMERFADQYVRWSRGAIMMSMGGFLASVDLSDGRGAPVSFQWPDRAIVAAARAAIEQTGNFDTVLDDFEAAVIADVRAECNGVEAETARRLGWKPDRLQQRKRRSDIKKT